MKREVFEVIQRQREEARQYEVKFCDMLGFGDLLGEKGPTEMALSPGVLMRQQIERDPYGLAAWDQTAASRCFVPWSTARPTRRSPARRHLIRR